MTRYIYIDASYKDAYMQSSSESQRATMKSVAMFMSASDTENEEGVEKKLILKGVTKEEFKAFTQDVEKESYENEEYENWMNYIKMACSQGDTTQVQFDEEDSGNDIEFFDRLIKDDEKLDIAKLNNTYWLSHCLCDKSLDECKKLERKYGISFIGIDQDITKHEPDATFFVKDKGYRWDDIIQGRKSNAIFIMDQYTFNPTDIMKANIVAILKNIICTNTEMQISAYTQKINMNLTDIENTIKAELTGINPNITINILSTSDTFHDRVLVSNNLYATIGGGFDALKVEDIGDGKHGSRKYTTLHIYSNPAISSKDWLRNEYFGYVNAISKKYDALNQTALHTRQPALMTNRLVRPIAEIAI